MSYLGCSVKEGEYFMGIISVATTDPILINPPAIGIVTVSSKHASMLAAANQRFQAMHGINVSIHPRQVLIDRTQFYHLYDSEAKHDLELTDENRIQFLHENTGISKNICASWVYSDFLEIIRRGDVSLDENICDVIWEAYESAMEYVK